MKTAHSLRVAALLCALPALSFAQAPPPASSSPAQAASQPAPVTPLCSLPLAAQPTPLLDNRLTLLVPATATVTPPVSSLMGVQQSAKDETDIALESGSQRGLILVHEMNETAGPDFAQKIKDEAADKANIAPLNAPGLHGFILSPKMIDNSAEAPMVGGAYVVRDDATVQSIGVYMNSDAVADQAACTAWAKKVIASVAAGPARLDAAPGERRMPVDAATALIARVPPGYVLSFQQGADFSLYRLRKLTAFGAPRGSLGIYVGDHPSPQHDQAQVDPRNVASSKGTLLGKPVTWEQWSPGDEGGHTVQVKETILPLPQARDRNLQLHVFMATTDQQLLPELSSVAQSLQLQSH